MPGRDEFFFPLQVIKELWGREWELIAQWAVGEDWSTTPFDRWPQRMTERTGVKVPPEEDMPLSLDRIRHAWDHRNDPAYKKLYLEDGLQPGFMPHAEYVAFMNEFGNETAAFLKDSGVIR